jgi:hypothetical protein
MTKRSTVYHTQIRERLFTSGPVWKRLTLGNRLRGELSHGLEQLETRTKGGGKQGDSRGSRVPPTMRISRNAGNDLDEHLQRSSAIVTSPTVSEQSYRIVRPSALHSRDRSIARCYVDPPPTVPKVVPSAKTIFLAGCGGVDPTLRVIVTSRSEFGRSDRQFLEQAQHAKLRLPMRAGADRCHEPWTRVLGA